MLVGMMLGLMMFVIGVDFGGQPGQVPLNNRESPMQFITFLPPFAHHILVCPPNIYAISTPVMLVVRMLVVMIGDGGIMLMATMMTTEIILQMRRMGVSQAAFISWLVMELGSTN